MILLSASVVNKTAFGSNTRTANPRTALSQIEQVVSHELMTVASR